jgi:hypothetical protein
MNKNQEQLLHQITDTIDPSLTAHNIRANGKSISRLSTKNINIIAKKNGTGIDIIIQPNTKNEIVHIPVLIDESGIEECVYNDFYIGEYADVQIIAGCGIHNDGSLASRHDGIHTFHVGKNARVKYMEKHYGDGQGNGKRNMNPKTVIEIEKNGFMEMETIQMQGIDSTKRSTTAKLAENATLIVKEKILTQGEQTAETDFDVNLCGENCSTNLISRSVAKNASRQIFRAKMQGNNKCYGHTECDAILMDQADISAIPEIAAHHLEANLVHEAVIGKIAGEQLIKLMTLGLSEKEAEEQIIHGFLK